MNAAIAACAASGLELDWHGINWAKCHQQVRRLQARIVKATQEGRFGKVKALQWLLTHSFSGKAIAVKRVTENKGKRTPGVDGVTWTAPEAKAQAVLSLKRRGYQPLPLRRVYIPKSNGSSRMRPLSIPAMKDRAMQALHLLALEPVSESTADRNSYGFRLERSTADAREQCFNVLARRISPTWILEGDIAGCFDNISSDWMVQNITTDKVTLQKWLKAGYVYQHKLFPTEAGTPQGGIASPTLANLTLDGLESKLEARFGQKGSKKAKANQVNLVRYADDFIITGKTKELLENEVRPVVEDFLKERGLSLSGEKTRVTHIGDGFDFLGWNLRKYDGKLLIKPSKKNVKAFLQDIRETVKANKQAKQENLIRLLNPKIRGWANYHKVAVAKKAFARVDSEIWIMLWQWAKRRHPAKGGAWVKDKYFKADGKRNWTFATSTKTPEREVLDVKLVKASDTKIQRHVKIRGDANPFDPKEEAYFEDRLGLKMQGSPAGQVKWYKLWWSQDKECPVCKNRIDRESGWRVHRIIPKSDGGKDIPSNLVMVHPYCHKRIHSLKLQIAKPAPVKGL
jgi:RNA-directed DNA polymerase